jgi:uncharacterized protein YndB with AHSA1/START domain
MKYMLLIYSDESIWTDNSRQECYVESTELTHQLCQSGQYLGASPLQPVATATSVRVRDGKQMVTDGPFAETREHLGGFFMIEANNLDEAISIAARIPGAKVGTIEIRPVVELPNLPSSPDVSAGDTSTRDLVSARVFDVPRDLMFKAWTDAEHLSKWWGPAGFTNTFHEFNPHPGGDWRFVMHGPDGRDYDNHIIFSVVTPQRLVLDHVSAPKFRLLVDFDELSTGTKVTFRMVFEKASVRDQLKGICVEANEQNFDRLQAQLQQMQRST